MNSNLWRRFEQVVKTYPDRAAIIHGETRWSFADLHNHALSMAGRLRGMGVEKAARVLLWLENRPEMAAALLGTWANGGVPVLVHAAAPIAHLKHAAATTDAVVCVLDRDQPQDLNGVDVSVLDVDDPLGTAAAAVQILRRFEQVVKTYPDRAAIIHGETRWSFADLHNHALSMAGRLRGMGVEKAARVLLWLENRPEMAVNP